METRSDRRGDPFIPEPKYPGITDSAWAFVLGEDKEPEEGVDFGGHLSEMLALLNDLSHALERLQDSHFDHTGARDPLAQGASRRLEAWRRSMTADLTLLKGWLTGKVRFASGQGPLRIDAGSFSATISHEFDSEANAKFIEVTFERLKEEDDGR
jgi:hypothetical protein